MPHRWQRLDLGLRWKWLPWSWKVRDVNWAQVGRGHQRPHRLHRSWGLPQRHHHRIRRSFHLGQMRRRTTCPRPISSAEGPNGICIIKALKSWIATNCSSLDCTWRCSYAYLDGNWRSVCSWMAWSWTARSALAAIHGRQESWQGFA